MDYDLFVRETLKLFSQMKNADARRKKKTKIKKRKKIRKKNTNIQTQN